jgi:hypothetical protein
MYNILFIELDIEVANCGTAGVKQPQAYVQFYSTNSYMAQRRKPLKENQGKKGLYRRREANPIRGENLKANPGPPGWELDIGPATQFRKKN